MSDKYTECKSDMFVFRYKSLKEMIKECISAYETLQKEEKKSRDRRQGGAGAFLEIATETNRVLSGNYCPLRCYLFRRNVSSLCFYSQRFVGK